MTLPADRWVDANRVFHDALAHPADARVAYVREACGDDQALCDEVLSLLGFHEHAETFLATPAADVTLAGTHVGPYRVLREVGHGGMGVVYLAEDTRLGRTVALKAIPPAWVDNEARRERLRHEARAAAALSHPGVAVVYALEEFGGQLFLASEFVRGTRLRDDLDHGPLPVGDAVAVARDLADALAAAHDRGIVHRDLKPDNIMRTPEGRVKVIDFGVAGFGPELDAASPGTPAYMSPEQRRGDPVDIRSDQYAFGIVLHELLTGAHPFATSETRTPLTIAHPQAVALDAIIARCLQTDPNDRYVSTNDLVSALARVPRAGQPATPAVQLPQSYFFSPFWWWQFHQVAITVTYGVVLYFLWAGREWSGDAAGQWLFLTGVAAALTAGTLRLHLWFTSRFYLEEWRGQRLLVWPFTRLADGVLGIVLLIAGMRHSTSHPDLAALFIGSAILVLLLFLIVEPSTTRAAEARMRQVDTGRD
jgi:predicted Ser/Thr protein kinase